MQRDHIYEKQVNGHIDRMASVLDSYGQKDSLLEIDQLAIERAFQVLVEALIGLSRYVLEKISGKKVTRSREAFDEMLKNGTVTGEEHAQLMKVIGFRNILVHDYLNVDPAIVRSLLQKKEYRSVLVMRDKVMALLQE